MSGSRGGTDPRTCRRARLASCRTASGLRPAISAISPKGTPNMSCRTKAIRSAGDRFSSTTSIAIPTVSDSSASSAGFSSLSSVMTGSTWSGTSAVSRRAFRERSMSRQTRLTTVVSQARRLSTSSEFDRLSRSQRLLHGVVGLARGAEHPVGDRVQVGAMLLEAVGEQFLVVHVTSSRSHPS